MYEDGGFRGILWNAARKRTGREIEFTIDVPAEGEREYVLVTKTVDEDTCEEVLDLSGKIVRGTPVGFLTEDILLLK